MTISGSNNSSDVGFKVFDIGLFGTFPERKNCV